MFNGSVAIIGRPNVGKSTLFNRLLGERVSIVLDKPGVTRDRIYGQAEWLTKRFQIIDTGGIALEKDFFQDKIKIQAQTAIDEADVIVFIVDGQTGPVADDEYIAKILQKSGKQVLVAVNKVDGVEKINDNYLFYRLGFSECFFISSIHGIGIGDLLDRIVTLLPNEDTIINEAEVKLAIIGRPNVGKSMLVNALLNEERVIVSDVAGTTRDAIDTHLEREGRDYLIIDTAGLKRRGKIVEQVDRFSADRTMSAIKRADICILVIDAKAGLLEQDKHVLNWAVENGKGSIIVLNKWDLMKEENKESVVASIYQIMPFATFMPITFVSALNRSGLNQLFSIIDEVAISINQKVSTGTLNEIILDSQMINPSPTYNGGNLKIFYALQDGVAPPRFTFFVNNPDFLHFSYQRFLENRIRDAYGFVGTPITFKFKRKT